MLMIGDGEDLSQCWRESAAICPPPTPVTRDPSWDLKPRARTWFNRNSLNQQFYEKCCFPKQTKTKQNLFVSSFLCLCLSEFLPKPLDGSAGSWKWFFIWSFRELRWTKTIVGSFRENLGPIWVSNEWTGPSSCSCVPVKNIKNMKNIKNIEAVSKSCWNLKISDKLFPPMLLCSTSFAAQTIHLYLNSLICKNGYAAEYVIRVLQWQLFLS